MRAVPRDVNASLSKPQQIEEICRASKSLPRSTRISDSNLIRQVLGQKPQTSKFIAKHQLSGDLGMALTVPKKLAKRAVDRNRIKRLVKEHYRVNKQPLHEFLNVNGKQVIVFFMYIDKALPENALLQRKMPLIIDKLINTLSESINQNN